MKWVFSILCLLPAIGYFVWGVDAAKGLLFGAFVALMNAWVYKIFFVIQTVNLTASPNTSLMLLFSSFALRMIMVIGLLYLGFRLNVEAKMMLIGFIVGQLAYVIDKLNIKEIKHGS